MPTGALICLGQPRTLSSVPSLGEWRADATHERLRARKRLSPETQSLCRPPLHATQCWNGFRYSALFRASMLFSRRHRPPTSCCLLSAFLLLPLSLSPRRTRSPSPQRERGRFSSSITRMAPSLVTGHAGKRWLRALVDMRFSRVFPLRCLYLASPIPRRPQLTDPWSFIRIALMS